MNIKRLATDCAVVLVSFSSLSAASEQVQLHQPLQLETGDKHTVVLEPNERILIYLERDRCLYSPEDSINRELISMELGRLGMARKLHPVRSNSEIGSERNLIDINNPYSQRIQFSLTKLQRNDGRCR